MLGDKWSWVNGVVIGDGLEKGEVDFDHVFWESRMCGLGNDKTLFAY